MSVIRLRWGTVATLVTIAGLACNPYSVDLRPRPPDPVERGEYDGPGPSVIGEGGPHVDEISKLARVFYVRITDRRFNSLSTFFDPALRELFHSPEAFADYFAALADALTVAHFKTLRPYEVEIHTLEVLGPDVILVSHHYKGDDSRPLWVFRTSLDRVDRWERTEDRWFIIPGKL